MADAKPPTRPPVAPARRSRVRDPRVDSSPPSGESAAAYYVESASVPSARHSLRSSDSPHDEVSESRPKAAPVSRNSRASSLGPTSSDTQAVLAQLAVLEDEMIQLREQKEKDEAMLGQMLARVADREHEAREARSETRNFEERATQAEARVAALEAEMADLDRAALEPLGGSALEEAEAATRAGELEQALAKVATLEEALARAADRSRGHDVEGPPARTESAELDMARVKTAEAEVAHARIAVLEETLRSLRGEVEEAHERATELEARAREVNEERETATAVAADLAEKIETLESSIEAGEAMARAAVEAKDAAERQARAHLDRIGELESALVVRDGRLDAAELHLDEAKESAVEAAERAKALEADLAKERAAAAEVAARCDGLTADLAKARKTTEDAGMHAKVLEADFAERTKELVGERAERKANEASLKKHHEESLGEQRAMFERQLRGLEEQLAEARGAKEKIELSFKELRVRSQETQAELASLEERLAAALDDRDSASRQVVTMKEAADRLAADLHAARREAARGREMVTHFSLAMMQLEKIDHDAVALRERLFHETRQAVMALPSPLERGTAAQADPPAQADVAPAREAAHTSVPPTRTFSSAPSPPSPPSPEAAPKPVISPSPPSQPAAPAPGDSDAMNEAEVSFASVAPPPSERLQAAAPLLRPSKVPTGVSNRSPSEPPVFGPSSDSEIRISVEEDEG